MDWVVQKEMVSLKNRGGTAESANVFALQIAVLTSFYFKPVQSKYENSLWCTTYKSKHEC